MRSLDVEGAVFLNDVTSDGEQAFVSDFMANRIWRYQAGRMVPWLTDDILNHPNGLLLEDDRLFVGSWGRGLRDDFSTDQPGSLLSIDLADQSIRVMSADIGNIDGVARIGTRLLVNDWVTGHLFEIGTDGTTNLVAEYAPGLADISAFGSTLLLPSMLAGSVAAETYP
jgi:sugar lactone lactonase YvrE